MMELLEVKEIILMDILKLTGVKSVSMLIGNFILAMRMLDYFYLV